MYTLDREVPDQNWLWNSTLIIWAYGLVQRAVIVDFGCVGVLPGSAFDELLEIFEILAQDGGPRVWPSLAKVLVCINEEHRSVGGMKYIGWWSIPDTKGKSSPVLKV